MAASEETNLIAAEKITKEYIKCPCCGESSGLAFTSDYQGGMTSWEHRHKACGGAFMYGYVNGSAVVGPIVGLPKVTPIVSLMVLPPQKYPVYLLIGDSTHSRNDDGTPNLDRDYYYNEHSCPTNWLNDIKAVIIEDDADPHGLIEHVRSLPEENYQRIRDEIRVGRGFGTDAEDGSDDGMTTYAGIVAAFPEIREVSSDDDSVIEMEEPSRDVNNVETREPPMTAQEAIRLVNVGRGMVKPILYGLPQPKKQEE